MKNVLLITILCFTAFAVKAQTDHHRMHRHVKHYSHHVQHHRSSHHSSSSYTRHNIKVSGDDAHAPYEGRSSRSNDGVRKNHQRNLNYQNNSQQLPPNSGNNSR